MNNNVQLGSPFILSPGSKLELSEFDDFTDSKYVSYQSDQQAKQVTDDLLSINRQGNRELLYRLYDREATEANYTIITAIAAIGCLFVGVLYFSL